MRRNPTPQTQSPNKFYSRHLLSLGLEVHKYYLLWVLRYVNGTYFGLFGGTGFGKARPQAAESAAVQRLGSSRGGWRCSNPPKPKRSKYPTIRHLPQSQNYDSEYGNFTYPTVGWHFGPL